MNRSKWNMGCGYLCEFCWVTWLSCESCNFLFWINCINCTSCLIAFISWMGCVSKLIGFCSVTQSCIDPDSRVTLVLLASQHDSQEALEVMWVTLSNTHWVTDLTDVTLVITWNTHFWTHLDLEWHLDGAYNTSIQHIFFHCLGCVLSHIPVSRWNFGWYGSLPSWFILTKKWAFLDVPWPGMALGEGQNGLKPSSHMYKQEYWCILSLKET